MLLLSLQHIDKTGIAAKVVMVLNYWETDVKFHWNTITEHGTSHSSFSK